MIVVGLTGSIGMGKSTVAEMFRREGVPVFDADAVVHALQAPGGALINPIEAAFPGITDARGVDRSALGSRVFGDPAALGRLEAIVHPAVARERERFAASNQTAEIVVYDIPLLLEKGRPAEIDAVVVVTAPTDVQGARVLARAGMSAAKFEAIRALQMPDAEKRQHADYVIDTGTTMETTHARVREVIACLKAHQGSS